MPRTFVEITNKASEKLDKYIESTIDPETETKHTRKEIGTKAVLYWLKANGGKK